MFRRHVCPSLCAQRCTNPQAAPGSAHGTPQQNQQHRQQPRISHLSLSTQSLPPFERKVHQYFCWRHLPLFTYCTLTTTTSLDTQPKTQNNLETSRRLIHQNTSVTQSLPSPPSPSSPKQKTTINTLPDTWAMSYLGPTTVEENLFPRPVDRHLVAASWSRNCRRRGKLYPPPPVQYPRRGGGGLLKHAHVQKFCYLSRGLSLLVPCTLRETKQNERTLPPADIR